MEIRPILSTLRKNQIATALIVLEIALSCAILCNALFLVSQRLDNIGQPSGIAESELLQIRLGGIGSRADADARTAEDLAALRAIPGVASATVANQVPFHGHGSNTVLSLSPDQVNPTLSAAKYDTHPGLLDTFGLRLVAGRDFLADEYEDGSKLYQMEDLSGVRGTIIVSASAARRLFPEQGAVGRTVYLGTIPLTIVGVVDTLARPGVMDGNTSHSVVFPVRLNYDNGGLYLLRVADPARRDEILEQAVAALERIDPDRLVQERRSYEEVRNGYFRNDREMIGLLVTVTLALLLVTALGIAGLANFWVQQRTRQIGVRRALGATRAQITRYFQTENFLIVGAGIALGMLLAFALNQWLMGHYELPRLPLQYLPAGAAALWAIGQVAVFGPARKAAGVPPAIATRGL
ncbi:ABC transporter permease [Pseudoxanthomonas broegbernensis]|uniref:ABC transporter permease n=1 Tax=Pseudoxanthomonas broegbernensis TaxID=83619 RepID=A0A7V8K7B1_9GAMM|nr:FtsX-like permease family protein [Pseudoxanthomonas broegbernensis]KAF1686660.1 ABC transporter permease [Pseudoxanthomonas broegbernensis]MBB6063581.1 putative ABC transport system permease protein [Pseudoxanthomonas broegbernensis]